jgi:hypothetical protein
MTRQRAKVHCEACGDWLLVTRTDEWIECDCGQRFAVTITPIPAPAA